MLARCGCRLVATEHGRSVCLRSGSGQGQGTGNLLKPRTRTGNGADYESVGLFDAFDFKHGLPTTSFTCQPQCSMHLIKCSRRIVRPVSERLNLQIRDACDAGQPIVIGNKKLAAFRHRTGQLDGIGRT